MISKLREYIDNNYKVTEYTKDGITVSHIVKELIDEGLPANPPEQTLKDQVASLKEDNLILMDALATTFEEIINLQAQIGGTA